MAVFSLRTAAQQAGTSKSTILRAIKGGRLSASRTADGGYEIDASELIRVYPPRPSGVATLLIQAGAVVLAVFALAFLWVLARDAWLEVTGR